MGRTKLKMLPYSRSVYERSAKSNRKSLKNANRLKSVWEQILKIKLERLLSENDLQLLFLIQRLLQNVYFLKIPSLTFILL